MQISYDQARTVNLQTSITEYEADQLEKIINYMQRKNIYPNTGSNSIKHTRRSVAYDAIKIFIDR